MNTATVFDRPFGQAPQSRSLRLKEQTRGVHERLDGTIMSAASFTNLEGYARFTGVQYLFHRDIDALYENAVLQTLLPGLRARRRVSLIAADLSDLGVTLPGNDPPPIFTPGTAADIPSALGWLYVAEGSNLGAAVLRKEAAKLGLSDQHGARHLAPSDGGPAAYWRAFTGALDGIELAEEEDARAVAGASAAFSRVQALVDARLG